MKRFLLLTLLLIALLSVSCTTDHASNIDETEQEQEVQTSDPILATDETHTEEEPEEAASTRSEISGQFMGTVRDMIPDYVLDDFTPMAAVVTTFQGRPFILSDGPSLAEKVEAGKAYIFEIEPLVVDVPAEYINNDVSSIMTTYPIHFKSITLFEEGGEVQPAIDIKPVQ